MAWFSKADLFIEQLKFDEAFSLFDSIQINYPYHSLADEILFKRAKAMELKGNSVRALGYYDDIIKFHSTDILADDALFRSAEILEENLLDKEEALDNYKRLLLDYPSSLYGHEARKRVRVLRGENPQNP
jgi:outer membrane protein assembly factor BamD (BamD/ComL family)